MWTLKFKLAWLERKGLETVHKSFIMQRLENSCKIYVRTYGNHWAKLWKFKLKILQIITGAMAESNSDEVIYEFHNDTFSKCITIVITFHKIHLGIGPCNWSNVLLTYCQHKNVYLRSHTYIECKISSLTFSIHY
jgi:hypothetical protein